LWALAARLREEIGLVESPMEQASVSPRFAAARAAMGDDAFESAWAEGRAMVLEQVIRDLLES
jgi:hypothetical protein